MVDQQRELIAQQQFLLNEAVAQLGHPIEPEPKPKRPPLRVVDEDG